MKLSVIVPTYRRGELLRRGLEGLASQTLARDRFEVMVVDDGSGEPPHEAVAAVADRMRVRLESKPNGGLAAARQYGVERTDGDVLMFMDDDIVPCPEFLAEHLKVHELDERAVALGSLPHPAEHLRQPFIHYLARIRHYDLFLRFGSAENIPLPPLNGNSSVRRAGYLEVGGYDLAFASYGGEDTELGYRLKSAGYRFVYADRAVGTHFHIKDFAAYEHDMYSSGVTMVMLVRKHPEVLARVNLDIVSGAARSVGLKKRLQRLTLQQLTRRPQLRRGLARLIDRLEPGGWCRVLYPVYMLLGHYQYALGMADELNAGGPIEVT